MAPMNRSGSSLAALTAGIIALVVSGTVLAATRFVAPDRTDTAAAADTTPATLDVLAYREDPDKSPADKHQIIQEYRRTAPGSHVLVKRVSWSAALSTPYGRELSWTQLNPNHASVYAVLVSGTIGSGQHPPKRRFVVLRLADREPLLEVGVDSPGDPSWYRSLRDLD